MVVLQAIQLLAWSCVVAEANVMKSRGSHMQRRLQPAGSRIGRKARMDVVQEVERRSTNELTAKDM